MDRSPDDPQHHHHEREDSADSADSGSTIRRGNERGSPTRSAARAGTGLGVEDEGRESIRLARTVGRPDLSRYGSTGDYYRSSHETGRQGRHHPFTSRPSAAAAAQVPASRRMVSSNNVTSDGGGSAGGGDLPARRSLSARPASTLGVATDAAGSRLRQLGKRRAGSSTFTGSEDDEADERRERSMPANLASSVRSLRSRAVESDGDVDDPGGGGHGFFDLDEELQGAALEALVESSADLDADAEYTLKDRQDAINEEHPFGLPIWKAALYKKNRSIQRNAEHALHQGPSEEAQSHLYPGNIFWSLFLGCPLAAVCFIVSLVLFVTPWGGRKYARVYRGLAGYLAWPFGKYVEGLRDPKTYAAFRETRDQEGKRDAEDDTSTIGPGSILNDQEDPGLGNGKVHRDRSPISQPNAEAERQPLTARNGYAPQMYGATVPSLNDLMPLQTKRRKKFRLRALGRMGYWFFLYTCVGPLMVLVCGLCWLFVFTVPMAKLIWLLLSYLSRDPLSLRFKQGSDPLETLRSYDVGSDDDDDDDSTDTAAAAAGPDRTIASAFKFTPEDGAARDRSAFAVQGPAGTGTVLLCIYKAVGFQYYKYTVDGINIIFINLLAIVFLAILQNFVVGPMTDFGRDASRIDIPPLLWLASRPAIFVLALASVVPLSYLIGMAVASISAQSSIGLGAVINASFGSIIEIILYAIALSEGKANLVEGSLVGSLLAGVLLMPGVSMVSGALRRKEQRFNSRSAGVTSTMLIMAIIGTLTPTLFYQIYGTFRLTCQDCEGIPTDQRHFSCHRCAYEQIDPVEDPFYQHVVKKLMYFCAGALVLSYLIGLWFSLRTHASHIWHDPKPTHGLEASLILPRDASFQSRPHRSMSTTRQKGGAGSVTRHQGRESVNGTPFTAFAHSNPAGSPLREDNLSLPQHMSPEMLASTLKRDSSPARRSRAASTTAKRRISAEYRRNDHQTSDFIGVSLPAGSAVPEEATHGGHDAPNWSRMKSATVLVICTALYSTIAEILVDTVDVVLKGSDIDEKFLGLTLFALVPNTTELANAVAFAMNGNIALSLEIGSAYALQVCLLQIPVMVTFSAFFDVGGPHDIGKDVFTLIWPRFDIIAIILSVFLLTYVYIEGRSNYFRGSILLLSYAVLIAGFYFAPAGRGDIVQDQG